MNIFNPKIPFHDICLSYYFKIVVRFLKLSLFVLYTIPVKTFLISFIIILIKVQWRWCWWFIYYYYYYMYYFFFFALQVNIYPQDMNIKRRLEWFDQITCIFVVVCFFLWFFVGFLFFVLYVCVCVCSLSPSIINYTCPNFRTTCALALQHEFELSTLPSIQQSWLWPMLMLVLL